jgi:hypothetical protein
MVLPEELRSQLLRSYSRDELKNYHRALLYAVETWRHFGLIQAGKPLWSGLAPQRNAH